MPYQDLFLLNFHFHLVHTILGPWYLS